MLSAMMEKSVTEAAKPQISCVNWNKANSTEVRENNSGKWHNGIARQS